MSVIPMVPSPSKGRWGCQIVDEDEDGDQAQDAGDLHLTLRGQKQIESIVR